MPAPTDLESLGYGRGELKSAPAQSIRRLDVALGRPVDINSAYRDWNEQMRLHLAYLAGRGPLALHPDTSWHCKGMAVDSDDNPSRNAALRPLWEENGWRFEVPSEDWHGQYYTSLDKNYGKPADSDSRPFPTPTEPTTFTLRKARPMDYVFIDDDGSGKPGYVLVNLTTGKVLLATSTAQANGWAQYWGNARKTPSGTAIPRQQFLNALDAIKKTT